MARRSLKRPMFVIAASALVVAFAAVSLASASNMAFKLNKQIWALGGGSKGRNLVALPARSPYQGAGGLTRLCTALGLSTNGQVQLFTGTGTIYTYICGTVETFQLLDGKGMIISDTADRNGILVGSDVPGKTIRIEDLGASPVGTNLFPVDYHTTAVNPQDLCNQCLLSPTATITRFDAQAGVVNVHVCGQVPLWNLVLGEAVMILEDNGPKVCSPSHF